MAILTAPHPIRSTAPAPTGPRRLRPGRGTGRGVGPGARPGRVLPAPSLPDDARVELVFAPAPESRVSPVSATSPSWRLTDRGVALVVVTGLMIVTAALTVIGLTALRVTSAATDAFAPGQTAQVGSGVQR